VALTSISVVSGFSTYRNLFSLEKAILILMSLESLRLVLIWLFIHSVWLKKLVIVPIYFCVVACCTLASMTSLYSEAAGDIDNELSRRIGIIKTKYAEKSEEDLLRLDEKINGCLISLAKHPESGYWNNRYSQRVSQRNALIEERDKLLSELPEEKEIWIQKHASILEIEFGPMPEKLQGSLATTSALGNILGYGLDLTSARRGLAYILIATIEINIMLISLVLKGEKQSHSKNSVYNELNKTFSDLELRKYCSKINQSLMRKSRLPYSSELGRRQRTLRKILQKYKINEEDFIGMINRGEV
jgi:hypothetical protein